jgi:uncharacterized protein YecE (DUF72 family)
MRAMDALVTKTIVDGPQIIKDDRCPVFVGTSGYSYAEWRDSGFYPKNIKTLDMLPLYCHNFKVVELNYTWYQMARADEISRMVVKAPADFQFAARLTRTLTHERPENWRQLLRTYRNGIAPLIKQLAAVLVQLPIEFERSRENRAYLAELLDGLHGLPIAVEFGHGSWAVDAVFAELERRKVTLVTVDQPEVPDFFPLLDVITNPDFFYIRFHGRNLSGYHSANIQKKYDFEYSERQLGEFYDAYIEKMCLQSQKGYAFFTNYVRAQAPRNGKMLMRTLAEL